MKKKNILLVEDDELDVISVQRTLRKLDIDYELHTAFNGKDALAMLKSPSDKILPDVILLDLNMPKMNGIEFLRVLRSDNELKNLKVFIMTTSAETVDRATTEQLGISGYIIKPLNYRDNTKRADSMDAFVQFHLRKILMDEPAGSFKENAQSICLCRTGLLLPVIGLFCIQSFRHINRLMLLPVGIMPYEPGNP